jgi:trans-aconitate methyltransferase
MPTDYEQVYLGAKRALGAPTKEFVKFFDTLASPRLRVLDLGCGQGRDALFIARLGHSVVGIDRSATGIRDLLADAQAEGLDVQGFVSDIRSFEPAGMYDVLLADRTLHMLDASDRPVVLARYLGRVEAGGYVLIADERSNIPTFMAVLEEDRRDWRIMQKRRGYLFAHQA